MAEQDQVFEFGSQNFRLFQNEDRWLEDIANNLKTSLPKPCNEISFTDLFKSRNNSQSHLDPDNPSEFARKMREIFGYFSSKFLREQLAGFFELSVDEYNSKILMKLYKDPLVLSIKLEVPQHSPQQEERRRTKSNSEVVELTFRKVSCESSDELLKKDFQQNFIEIENFIQEAADVTEENVMIDIFHELYVNLVRINPTEPIDDFHQEEYVKANMLHTIAVISQFFQRIIDLHPASKERIVLRHERKRISTTLKEFWGWLTEKRYPWSTNPSFESLEDDLAIMLSVGDDRNSIPTISAELKNINLTKNIEESSKVKEISADMRQSVLYQVLLGLNAYIVSDYVNLIFYKWPMEEAMEWHVNDDGTLCLNSPRLKILLIDNTNPYSETRLTMKSLFSLIIYDSISKALSLDHSEGYFQINNAEDSIERMNTTWKENVVRFLEMCVKLDSELPKFEEPSPRCDQGDQNPKSLDDDDDDDYENDDDIDDIGGSDYRSKSSKRKGDFKAPEENREGTKTKRSKTKDANDQTEGSATVDDHTGSLPMSREGVLFVNDLEDKLIIPEASTCASVKFVLPFDLYKGYASRLEDVYFKNKLLYAISKASTKIRQTGKIFLKVYDDAEAFRLKEYDNDESSDEDEPDLPEADLYRYRQSKNCSSKQQCEIMEEEYQSELTINKRIESHNLTAEEGSKIRSPELLGHGAIIVNTVEERIFQGYFLAFEYVDNVERKPTSQRDFSALKKQIDLLHSNDIHHGDLFKRNIFMDNEDASILDYGRSEIISESDEFDKRLCSKKRCEDYIHFQKLVDEAEKCEKSGD